MNHTGTTKNTNHAGQQGHGRKHWQLGRETFIDQIIARAGKTSGSRPTSHQEASSQQPRIQHSLPHLELSREYVFNDSETKQPLEDNLEHVEDQGSTVKPHFEYHLFGWPVIQEEWEQYKSEQCRREAKSRNIRNIEREETILEEHEVENEEIVPTLELPIKITPRNHPMKNIPLSTLPNFHGLASDNPNEFPFEFNILYRSYD